MTRNRRIVTMLMIIATLAAVLTVLASGLIVASTTLPSSGTIISTINVGVYSDSACTTPLTSIAWGTVSPGGSVVKTVYVKNTGTGQVTLSLAATNWNPTIANGPIALRWNLEGQILAPGNSAIATLTLTTQSTLSGITSFSIDIVISGSG